MVKSMRSSFPISFNALSISLHSSSRSSLQSFPTELLFIIFQGLDIPTLLKVCNVCKRFQQIATEILSKKFNEPVVELRLGFEQEYKYMFNVSFVLSKFDKTSGNLVFKPKQSMDSTEYLRFVHSPMVKSPDLSKIFISISNNNASTINNNDLTTSTTTTTTSKSSPPSSTPNSSKKDKILKENFLEKPLTLNIKSNSDFQEEKKYVYRVGHGTTHLRIPYIFTYSITDKPPPSMQKSRDGGGERWLKPISFECAPSFFYPREPIAYKIFMKIKYLGKRNSHKKSSSSPSSKVQNNKQEQKENINFQEVEDFISVQVVKDTSCKEKPMNRNLQGHLKGNLTKRWIKGARS